MSRYFVVNIGFLILLLVSLSIEGAFDVPLLWYVALAVSYITINVFGSVVLSMQYFVPVKFKGNREQKAIAITFDDGPMEGNTEKILDILSQYKVPAAFFCIGNRVTKQPRLVERIDAEGHLLGNHSYLHAATFDLQSAAMITKELEDTDTAIAQATGKKPRFFRPPYGVTNPMVAKAIRKRNYTVIGWSIRSFDTVIKDRNKLLDRVTKPLRGGDIVLFHDYSSSMLDILPAFLDHVKKLGLKVVRVDELVNEKAYG